MKRSYITMLCEFLPEDSSYFRLNGIGRDRASRLALALNDPKIGWNFLRGLQADGLPLPEEIGYLPLMQANAYLYGANNEAMDMALCLLHPENTTTANLLKGLLISRDVTLENIGAFMKLPFEVVRLFHELFFNVRDRLDEPGFLAQLLNPDGVRINDEGDGEDLLLMRAGVRYGAREVIRLMRVKAETDTESAEELRQGFESDVLRGANACIRHGSTEDIDSPVVGLAKTLVVAEKRNQRDEPPRNRDTEALMGIADKNPVVKCLEQMTKANVAEMIAANQQAANKPASPASTEQAG